MSIADIQKSTEQKMQKSVEALKHDYAKVRTGRAHIGLLDHIHVDYYGSATPITQLSSVNRSSKKQFATPTSGLIRQPAATSCACRCRP